MSILIKGMKMPRGCCDCDIWSKCFKEQPTSRTWIFTLRKLENCPLVEVPTPHGRLIDKDELEVDTEWSDYYDGYQSYSAMQIKYAPTVIESEE